MTANDHDLRTRLRTWTFHYSSEKISISERRPRIRGRAASAHSLWGRLGKSRSHDAMNQGVRELRGRIVMDEVLQEDGNQRMQGQLTTIMSCEEEEEEERHMSEPRS